MFARDASPSKSTLTFFSGNPYRSRAFSRFFASATAPSSGLEPEALLMPTISAVRDEAGTGFGLTTATARALGAARKTSLDDEPRSLSSDATRSDVGGGTSSERSLENRTVRVTGPKSNQSTTQNAVRKSLPAPQITPPNMGDRGVAVQKKKGAPHGTPF